MKKLILFFLSLFIIPINISALDYVATASDDRIFHSKEDANKYGGRAYTSLNINISNIENLASFRMNVIYDDNVIGISGCMYLYTIGIGCSGGDGSIFFDYSQRIVDRLNKYNLYTVTFMPIESTPISGKTNVIVEFENVKDKDQNDVYIAPLNLEYTFEPFYMKWNGPTGTTDSENNENNSNKDQENNNANDSNNQNDNLVVTPPSADNNPNTTVEETKKSNNNNLKSLSVLGYEIEFNKDIYEYIIEIDQVVEKLEITTELEDSKANIFIEGNESLSSNNSNTIIVKVIAEDLSEKEYLIKTVKKEEIITEIEEKVNDNNVPKIITYVFMLLTLMFYVVLIIKNSSKYKKL